MRLGEGKRFVKRCDMNTLRHLSIQVSVWGGDQGNGGLQWRKNIPDAAAGWRFSPMNFQIRRKASREAAFETRCRLKLWSKHTYGEASAWWTRRAQARECAEMKRKRSEELGVWLVPHCHYPHFLATVGRLPCNEGQFQGFSPGTHTHNSAVFLLTEVSLTLSLHPGL